jgi:Na+-driven multidrug efflux pump
VTTLRISSFAYCFSAYTMAFSQAFNGAGDSDTPTKINLFCFWGLQLPLAYTLARTMGWGLSGVLVAIVCSMAVWALIGAIVFKRGKWKERKV